VSELEIEINLESVVEVNLEILVKRMEFDIERVEICWG
jgi:hypothetical protein